MINCEFENGRKAGLRHATVDAIVIKEAKILLVKRALEMFAGGKYSLPGGYLDRDETAAEGALRELKEETGFEGQAAKLFLINDNPVRKGEDRQNITFVYIVEAKEKTGESDEEIEKIEWFKLDSLPAAECFAFDHCDIIKLYLEYRKKEFGLPKIGM